MQLAKVQVPLPPLPPLIHPLVGKPEWLDVFGTAREGGKRRHEGLDIGAPKLRPVVACFPGTVSLTLGLGGLGRSVFLKGDCGWSAIYAHLNDDTPGTDDDKGDLRFTFSPGIQNGTHVRSGQLLGYVGNSGNAKFAGSHLHFELAPSGGKAQDPAPYLKTARTLSRPHPASAPAIPAVLNNKRRSGPLLKSVVSQPLAGLVALSTTADPTPRKATTFYTLCLNGRERLRFRVTPTTLRLDTRRFPNGRYTLTLVRRDAATGRSFETYRQSITLRNRALAPGKKPPHRRVSGKLGNG